MCKFEWPYICKWNIYTWIECMALRKLDVGRGRETHSWWRHQMESFSALLALCEENPPVTGGLSSQRPVTGTFDDFFDSHLNKKLSKQSTRRWFDTQLRSSCRHCNVWEQHHLWMLSTLNISCQLGIIIWNTLRPRVRNILWFEDKLGCVVKLAQFYLFCGMPNTFPCW